MNGEKIVSVIVPVYNESEVIEAFYARLLPVMESLTGYRYEIIFVDDGSRDDSIEKLSHFARGNPNVKILKFSRNFGHQIAITAGIDEAKGDAIVVIDADLQDPPEVIRDFVQKWEEGYDVVYGQRQEREGETAMKLITASTFYRLLKRIAKIDIPVDTGDFRLITRAVADQLRNMREKDRFVRGLVSWVGFKQTGVNYKRDKRYAGETKYPYRKMLKFALDGITSFSTAPLKLATWLGYATSFLAFLYLTSVFVQKILGITVHGWATIMVAILFLGGIQLISLGIMGEYIGRIFTEIKQRPLYVVDQVIQYTENDKQPKNSDPHPAPGKPSRKKVDKN